MNTVELDQITLMGLSLKAKTSNKNGQSAIDCGNLWQEFETGDYINRIPDRVSDEMLAVYHQYEGDHSLPFSYFIGCRVPAGTKVPPGLDTLTIPGGAYQKMKAKGTMPDCVAMAWKEIWSSGIRRGYTVDFEVYGERSRDWSDAEVDIFLAVNLKDLTTTVFV